MALAAVITSAWHSHLDTRHPGLDADAQNAPRPLPRPPIKRRLVAERVNFTAWDAHRLLEQESEAIQARPGHPLG